MNSPKLLLICVASFLVTLATSAATVRGQQPPSHDPNPDMSKHWNKKHARALAELSQSVEFDFFETPLEEVADIIVDHHKLDIHLDVNALDTLGIDSSTPITVQRTNLSLRTALDLMLAELDLEYYVKEGILVITSAEEAELVLDTEVYELRKLSRPDPDLMKKMITLITTVVEPDSWSSVGGQGAIVAYEDVLVVSQTWRTHRQIAELLDKLSKAGIGTRTVRDGPVPQYGEFDDDPEPERARVGSSK